MLNGSSGQYMKQNRKRVKWRGHLPGWFLVLGLCLGCRSSAPPSTASTQSFRVLTFNLHHGEGLDGQVNLTRIAEVIRQTGADLVALQEVDKGVQRTDRRDLPAELASLTGLKSVFSNNFHFQGGEYGNAVLTRFPVLSVTNTHYQMLQTNEQRGLLQVTVEVFGRPLVFMNTHIDYRRDDTERLLNVREMETAAGQPAPTPVVLCGDFNDVPDSRVHRQLKQTFTDTWETASRDTGWTYPAGKPNKRIDYVWVSKTAAIQVVSARVIESDASDHRPVLVELRFK